MKRLYIAVHTINGVSLHRESVPLSELERFDIAYRPPIDMQGRGIEIRLSIKEADNERN